MTFHSSRSTVRKLTIAAGAVFCPNCRQLVCPVPDPDALAAAIIKRTIAAMEQSIEQDAARLRALGVEDFDSLLRDATPEEVQPLLPLLDSIRQRIARKEPAPVTIRSLTREVRRLGATAGFARCTCGAILTPEMVRPKPLICSEECKPPAELDALLPLATAAEKRELQDMLNRCLDQLPDAKPRPYQFAFAKSLDPGSCCPTCGAPVDTGPGVKFVIIFCPTPAGLLDILNHDPVMALRYAELEIALRQRAAVEALSIGSTRPLNEEGGSGW